MRKVLTTALIVMISICMLQAQGQPSDKTIVDLLAQLHSPRWTERASAYKQISRNPVAMQQAKVRSELLDLLDRENDPHAPPDPDLSDATAESYGEYTSALGGTVLTFADRQDSRELCILAHSPFAPDSKFAAKLAELGPSIVPCLMQMSSSQDFADRYQAIAVLVQIRAKAPELDTKTSEEVKQLILAALHDPNEMVRIGTIETLGSFGSGDMIPALEQVAQSDPAPEVQGVSIRKFAAKAVVTIQKRAVK